MEIYVKLTQNGFINELSAFSKPGFINCNCQDNDIFSLYQYFIINDSGEAILNPIYRKLLENEYVINHNHPRINMILFKPVVEHVDTPLVTLDPSEYDIRDIWDHLNDYYDYDVSTNKLVKNVVNESNYILKNQINAIIEQLSKTDYKVIKNMEASLNNETLPYDNAELTAQRNAWRDEISVLESQIV